MSLAGSNSGWVTSSSQRSSYSLSQAGGSGGGFSAGLSRLSGGGGALGGGGYSLGVGGSGFGGGLGIASLSLGGGGGGGAAFGGFGAGAGGGSFGLGGGLGGGYGGGYGGGLGGSAAFSLGRSLTSGGLSSTLNVGAPRVIPQLLSRSTEKQTLAGLNDRFFSYVEKVKHLQFENQTLQTQLNLLTGGTGSGPSDSSTTVNFELQLTDLRNTVETLTLENVRHEIELDNIRGAAEELKTKYELELGVKYQLETDIAAMKRDIEVATELRTTLEQRFSAALDDLEFLKKTHEEELSTLQSKLGTTADTSVSLIEVDAVKSFDLTTSLNKLRGAYEKSVQQHKEDAEVYFRTKIEEINSETVKTSEVVASVKAEISSTKKELQALNTELQSLLSVNYTLESNLAEVAARSSVGVAEFQAQITSYESAIESAKVELHKIIVNYQELLDIKQALDVEISTYKKLLEGEDLKLPDGEVLTGGTFTYSTDGGFQKKDSSSSFSAEFSFSRKDLSTALKDIMQSITVREKGQNS